MLMKKAGQASCNTGPDKGDSEFIRSCWKFYCMDLIDFPHCEQEQKKSFGYFLQQIIN